MKSLNRLLVKIDIDRAMHFLVAYIITIQFYLFSGSFEWCAFGCVVTCFLAYCKEWFLDADTGADIMDGLWSYIGAFLAFGQSVLIVML